MSKTAKSLLAIFVVLVLVVGILAFAVSRSPMGLGGLLNGGPHEEMTDNKANIPLVSFNPPPVPKDEIGKHPNILLIIGDDMGLDAAPCYPNVGSEKPNMPNLEKLCKAGVTFDKAWVNPVCSPTRATMMSGEYGFRTGVLDVDETLSPDVESIADVLTNKVPVPYANAFIGKWHMSGPSQDADLNAPSALGVQYFAGFLAGGLTNYYKYDLDEQGKVTHETTYATTLFTDKAIAWINGQTAKDPNRPWFMWLAYNAPHDPIHLPPKNLITDQTLSGSKRDIAANPTKYYLASLEALDKEMGRLFDSIDPKVLANTTIIFIGDNGTPGEVIQAPYSASHAKGSLYDGGVWAPITVAGKGVTRQGVRESALVNGTDLYATIADIAGSDIKKINDSTSFKQTFTSAGYNGRNFIYSEQVPASGPARANGWTVRDQQYKIIEYSNGVREMFDMNADPFEQTNLLMSPLSADMQKEFNTLEKYGLDLRSSNSLF